MTSFKHPPPVEDLGDLAWRRIEANVLAQIEASDAPAPANLRNKQRRMPWLAAGAALAAAGVLLIVWQSTNTSSATRSEISRVVTHSDATSITLQDSSLRVHPESALVVNQTSAGTHVVVERGAVTCAVQKRSKSTPFVVSAGDVRVEVVGTKFTVARDGDSAKVSVEHGVVRIRSGAYDSTITAGQSWPVVVAKSNVTDVTDDAEDESDESVESVEAETSNGPSASDVVDVPKAAAAAREQTRKSVAKTRNRDERELQKQTAPTISPKARYQRAAALEASDPDGADRLYAAIEAEGGAWAATALFARGRLAVERGAADNAAILLRRYTKRYPTGANVADAEALLRKLGR